jgi:flagellar motor protein MotB
MSISSTHFDGSEEGGESYFASVSDLMVGILFVFLLMLTVFALNFRDTEDQQQVKLQQLIEQQKKTKEAEERANRAIARADRAEADARTKEENNHRLRALLQQAVAQLKRDIEYRQNMRTQLLQSLQKTLSDRDIVVQIDPVSGILRLSGDILFATNDPNLQPDALIKVGALGAALGGVLPCYAAAAAVRPRCPADTSPILDAVLVEGHTDRQIYKSLTPTQSQEKNDELSTARALSVFKRLWQGAYGLDRLRNDDGLALLGFSGYGDRRPLPDSLGTTQGDYERNRRIDLRFVLSPRTSDEFNKLQQQIDQALGRP